MKHKISISFCMILIGCILIGGCSDPKNQNQYLPKELLLKADILGYDGVRFYSDNEESIAALLQDRIMAIKRSSKNTNALVDDHIETYLSISGGGANGAYAAGILNGWLETGKKPKFDIVTGISSGALIAPFAYLGVNYKKNMRDAFTTYSTKDLSDDNIILAILGLRKAISSNEKLKEVINKNITPELVSEIAIEYQKGRMLLIGTTNIQAQEPVIWDIGAIAISNKPDSTQLIQSIILASVSIPEKYPPVPFFSEFNGQKYEEHHVDGGLTREVFLFPSSLQLNKANVLFKKRPKRIAYIIRSGNIVADYENKDYSMVDLLRRSISSLIKTQAIGDLYRISYFCKKNDIEFKLEYIPKEFLRTNNEFFDKDYMSELYNLGYQHGLKGGLWKNTPPEFP